MPHHITRIFEPLLRFLRPAPWRLPAGPYRVARERREEARRQRARRRALWCAVHGIDVGPRLIHGMEVTA
ncbi:hypothetical protein [Streptomyces sp. H27-D2]|uniref:hypothetical protein n=1 Tax=Streptomyces sp. H27-D2 TaxID=3046304 RepID=UPI002DBF25E1|nr:hypothetical protein [Streptomyces sp. H27-D2]MEC4020648.1 hypothetical protein [Streptomyces sp. H27-D2]